MPVLERHPSGWVERCINPYMRYGGETIEKQLEIEQCHQAFEEGADAMAKEKRPRVGFSKWY